jgi:hypothetical protein
MLGSMGEVGLLTRACSRCWGWAIAGQLVSINPAYAVFIIIRYWSFTVA